MSKPSDDKYISIDEAAEYIGIIDGHATKMYKEQGGHSSASEIQAFVGGL